MRILRVLALVAAAVVGQLLVGPTTAAQPDPDLAARLDATISARIAQMGVPGAVVSLSIPGEIDYVRAFGVSDTATGTPMTVDHHTRIGSVTKTFTGTAVLQLVDQGRISLADPISRYVDGVPNGDLITLDMLGRMRSGLPDYTETKGFEQRLLAEAPAGPTAMATTPRELIDWAFAEPVRFAPGERFEYSNTNTVLLGMVVEKVSGLPLGEYLQRNVFAPLGLRHTSYPADGVLPTPFAHGYADGPGDRIIDTTWWNPSWADAAGKIVSTAADLRTWAAAVGRGALLRPETHQQRLAGGSPAAQGVSYSFALFDTEGWLGHNGDIPGYATVAVYLPERDATLVVIVNSDVPKPHSAGQLAYDITSIATPDHLYAIGPRPPALLEQPVG